MDYLKTVNFQLKTKAREPGIFRWAPDFFIGAIIMRILN